MDQGEEASGLWIRAMRHPVGSALDPRAGCGPGQSGPPIVEAVEETAVAELSLRVAAEVRAWMARRGVRQESLAAKMGLSQSALSMRLRGRTRWTINDLAAVSEALDVPMAALWTPPLSN